MIRTLVCVAASLLLVGTLYAEDKEKAAVPEKKPEAKAAGATQVTPETKKVEPAVPQRGRGRGGRSEGGGHQGRVTKVESGVIKLSADGKEYEFPITDNTRAMLRITEKDGKEVVGAVQLMNGDVRQGVRRPDGQKRTRTRTKP